MLSGQSGFQEVFLGGQNECVAYAPIASSGWSLGVRIPSALEFAPAKNEIYGLAWHVSLLLVVILTIVYVAVGGLLRPLGNFSEATSQIAQGNLDIELDARRNDEWGQLATALNDMAERLRARESALRESHGERLAQMLQGVDSKLYCYSLHPNGDVEYISPSVENVLGYTPDEFKSLFKTHPTGNSLNSTARTHHAAALAGQTPPNYEIECLHKDGSIRRLEVCEQPLLANNGQVISVEGLVNDITSNHGPRRGSAT